MASRSRFVESLPEGVESHSDLQEMHGRPMNGLPDIYWIDAAIIDELRP